MRSFNDYFFQTADGLRLYARDYPSPDINAPVLLCLHGLTRNSRDFESLAQAWRATSVSWCQSSAVAAGRITLRMYRATRSSSMWRTRGASLLSWVLQRLSVVGTSMGGLMTFALNALSPGLIERGRHQRHRS